MCPDLQLSGKMDLGLEKKNKKKNWTVLCRDLPLEDTATHSGSCVCMSSLPKQTNKMSQYIRYEKWKSIGSYILEKTKFVHIIISR